MNTQNNKSSLKSLVFFILIFISGCFVVFFHIKNLNEQLLYSTAKESARRYAEVITQFRSLYTSEVIATLEQRDIEISHEYYLHDDAVPLPATLTLLLGKEMKKRGFDVGVRLYSPFPFPWRKEQGGLRDEFEKQAWQALTHSPGEPYIRVESYQGVRSIRYAVADVMREKCIDCHNGHPQTPILGWQLGDVRGVLEIIMPMASGFAQVDAIFTQLVAMISVLLFGSMLGGGYLLLVRGHKERIKAEHKELTIQYQNSIKMAELGTMVASITHEISTPLGNIALALDLHYHATTATAKLLTDKTLKHDHLTQYFEQATQAVELSIGNNKRVLVLISSFKNVAVNQCSQKMFEIDVADYLNDVVMMLHPTLKRTTHQVVLNVDANIRVKCLAGSLAQVVTNIVNNAILHAFDGIEQGVVTISVRDGNMVEVKISDNGLGMSDELIPRVFEEYFTTKQGQGGSGLGLTICRQLVTQDLKGQLTLSSELGAGTVVTFTISKHHSEVVN